MGVYFLKTRELASGRALKRTHLFNQRTTNAMDYINQRIIHMCPDKEKKRVLPRRIRITWGRFP